MTDALDILFLSHSPDNPNGGASRIYHLLSAALRERGHRVDLHHVEDFGLPKGRRARLAVQRFVMPHYVSRFGASRDLDRYDVVMSSSGMAAPLFRKLGRRRNRPVTVNHLHGLSLYDHIANLTEHHLGHRRTGLAYRLVTGPFQVRWDLAGILSADLTIVQNLRDFGWVLPRLPEAARVVMIPAAVHPDVLRANQSQDVARERNRILWFATWESRKGAHYVPGAFRLVREKMPEVRLAIGGSGKTVDDIRACFDLRDRDHVEVLPHLTIEEQATEFARASIFLFPSLSEGFGLVLVEALCFGTAAVTSNTGFGGDFLRDGTNARVVYPSTNHIYGAILDLLGNEDDRTRLGKNGRAIAEQFTIARMAEAYENAFLELRDQRAGPTTSRAGNASTRQGTG